MIDENKDMLTKLIAQCKNTALGMGNVDDEYTKSLISKLERMLKKYDDNKAVEVAKKDQLELGFEGETKKVFYVDAGNIDTGEFVDHMKEYYSDKPKHENAPTELLDKASLTELYNILEDCDLIKGKDRDKVRQKSSERPTLKYKHIFSSRGEEEPTGRFVRSELSCSPKLSGKTYTERLVIANQFNKEAKDAMCKKDEEESRDAILAKKNDLTLSNKEKLMVDMTEQMNWAPTLVSPSTYGKAPLDTTVFAEKIRKNDIDSRIQKLLDEGTEESVEQALQLVRDEGAIEKEFNTRLVEETVVFDTNECLNKQYNQIFAILENIYVNFDSFVSECPCVRLVTPESGVVSFDLNHEDAWKYLNRMVYENQPERKSYTVTVKYSVNNKPVEKTPKGAHTGGSDHITEEDLVPLKETIIKNMIMDRVKDAFSTLITDIAKDIALLVK